MDCTASFLSYRETGYFSKIILDYIQQEDVIQPFFSHPVSIAGIEASIGCRKKFGTNRKLLVSVLQKQYAEVSTSERVTANIDLLLHENTFTFCTAHQPNIFTGPLYFIYKILHVARLAEQMKAQLPGNNFVPVYYMGSEDADLAELNHIYIDGDKHEWPTAQTGAVGRMKTDKALVQLLNGLEGQLSIHPFGSEIISMVRAAYQESITIEAATFRLVNQLFADYGVVVVLPDNAELKASFIPVIEKELTSGFSHIAVQQTVEAFPADYKVQASGRELNMFYLVEDRRERIELKEEGYRVVNTDFAFTKEEMIAELHQHPERFSPNVILRPVFQEWILPNIAFVGGGGELAYWLQLKKVFDVAETPFPVLVLRNSFLLIGSEMRALKEKLKFSDADLFQAERGLLNQLVKRESALQLSLKNEVEQMTALYESVKVTVGKIDPTLQGHTAALQTQAIQRLLTLEKKMLRAERKKFASQERQVHKLKNQLFPNNNLQERIDNLLPYYAKWGKAFLQMLYNYSRGLDQEFGLLVQGPAE